MFANFRVGDFTEGDAAVCRIRSLGNLSAVFLCCEGKFSLRQVFAGKLLGRHELNRRALRCRLLICILKNNTAFGICRSRLQLIAFLSDIHPDFIGVRIIADVGFSSFRLSYCVGMFTSFRVSDFTEGNAAVCLIRSPGNNAVTLFYLEAELVVLQLFVSAGEFLGRSQFNRSALFCRLRHSLIIKGY